MKNLSFILIFGFALFAMFFGSGNLVFPLQIGKYSGQYWFFGFLGLFCTGIFLPFLGLFVIKIHKGDYFSFFNEGGKFLGFILPLFTLSLLGSFGVVPRCITVAHGGLLDIFPKLSLAYFSLIFSLSMYFLCLKESTVITTLGKWLSPILVLSLVILIYLGIINNEKDFLPTNINLLQSFKNGFSTGYQMMDLFAAFFFSAFIFKKMKEDINPIWPSIIAAFLLSFIYLGLVFLGSHYSQIIDGLSPEQLLAAIAYHIMGKNAGFIVAIAMVFSCLTTAIALNNIYADYLCKLLKLDNKKFSIVLFFVTFISFTISLLDFTGIAAFLGPCLEISYPGITVLTIACILTSKHQIFKKFLFYIITTLMLIKWVLI